MKNTVLIIFLFFSFFNGISQEFSEKEIVKLNKLNITTNNLDLSDVAVKDNLNKILKLDRKRKTNKTVGIILTSASVTSFILGGALLKKDNGLTDILGGVMIAGGAVSGGISIPFWTASKKRKKERDKLIEIFDPK